MKKILFFLLITVSALSFSQQKGKDYSNILKSKNIFEINAFLRDAHPDDPKRAVLRPKVMEMMKEYIKNAAPTDPKLKRVQEMYAMLRSGKSSTKISFGEMNEAIKQKQIRKLQEELAGKPVNSTIASNTKKTETTTASKNVAIASSSKSSASATKSSSSSSASKAADAMAAEADEFSMLMTESPEVKKQRTVQILNQLFDNDPTTTETAIFIENKSDCNIIVRIEGAGNQKYRLPVPAKGDNTMVIKKGEYIFTSNVCGAQYASQKTVQKSLMVSLSSPK